MRSDSAQADDAQRLTLAADPNGSFAEHPLHRRAVTLAAQIQELEDQFTTTLVAQELPQPRETHLLQRGEYDRPVGTPLEPDVLAVMGALPADQPRNRLGLARWLTAREHPLVARVLVNRIWQRVFGDGLVRTPEDFGLQGEQPTHPELLDWLAVELHDSGWDLKHMLRLMVLSGRSAKVRPGARRSTTRRTGCWPAARGYRLDAEVIRDIGLWSSGLLDPHMGGEGVKPYQPDGLWSALMHPASNTKKYVRDHGARALPPQPVRLLETDQPASDDDAVRRAQPRGQLRAPFAHQHARCSRWGC